MKIGCCISADYYDELVRCGYQSITLAAKDIAACDGKQLQAIRQKLDNGPLEHTCLNNFCSPELRLHGEGFSVDILSEYMKSLCEKAEKLEICYIGIGAPASRNLQAGEDKKTALEQFRVSAETMCHIAEAYGEEILMESVCSVECNFLTTTKEMLNFIKSVNAGNCHLVYDIYHEETERQPVSIIQEAASEIKVVHIAHNKDNKRAYLSPDHVEKYRRYWDALQEIGYTGEWNIEAFIGDPLTELSQTMQIMKKVKREDE